jgi:hypothetical protein
MLRAGRSLGSGVGIKAFLVRDCGEDRMPQGPAFHGGTDGSYDEGLAVDRTPALTAPHKVVEMILEAWILKAWG